MECNNIVLEFVRQRFLVIGCLIAMLLAAGNAFAQELILPAPEMPSFTLGSISQTRDAAGRPLITVDYQRTKDGVGSALLAGKTPNGPHKIIGGQTIKDASGKIQLNDLLPNGNSIEAELFLVVSGSFAEECPYQCLVSNVVRIGNFNGPAASARDWSDKENDAYQKDLIGRKPPISPPPGYQLVQSGTKLIAGMPVKVGRFGEWVDAEVLANEAQVTVKIAGVSSLRNVTRNGWIAVSPSELQQAYAAPSSFKPSIKVIPGTTHEIPAGYVVLTESINLVPGTPVRAVRLDNLVDATVLSIEAEKLLLHYDSQSSSFDDKIARSSVVIAESTLEQLAKPDAVQAFESRIPKRPIVGPESDEPAKVIEFESNRMPIGSDPKPADALIGRPNTGGFDNANGLPARTLTIQNSPIDLPIPKEAELVPLDFPLPRGTKLAACSGRRWNYVTVIKDSTDDNVPIHWDDRTSDSDGLIHRSQLIIRKYDLKKMKAKAAKPEKRDWTDATGKYKVDAKLSSRTATHITLIKEDGKEVTLPIEKLSTADQKWLKENP